jgi:EAL domain-containing protein (putative c-di-GMP-specific phosphodiesterase class I)
VETEDDLRLVRDLGIDLVQGFLISAPRSPRELVSQNLLAEWGPQEATPAARR